MRYLLVALALLSLLTSCAQLSDWKQRWETSLEATVVGESNTDEGEGAEEQQPEEASPEVKADSPTVVIDEAKQLREKGDWSQAIDILEQAGQDFPQNGEIHKALDELKASWQRERRLLDDRMLVIDTAALTAKLPLLELRSKGEPDNLLLKSRLLFWEKYLQSQVDPLVSCGISHEGRYLWLARKCLQLADKTAPSPHITKLLEEIFAKIELRQQVSSSKEDKEEELERVRQVQVLLENAERDMQRGEYPSALSKLDEALRQDPENSKVRELLSKAQSELDLQVKSLVKLGDSLYHNEQIGPAVKVWETALRLDPNQVEIKEKIDRARKVLEKLEEIRSRESSSAAEQGDQGT